MVPKEVLIFFRTIVGATEIVCLFNSSTDFNLSDASWLQDFAEEHLPRESEGRVHRDDSLSKKHGSWLFSLVLVSGEPTSFLHPNLVAKTNMHFSGVAIVSDLIEWL
jgi:hypothetical protein